ncbi:lysophospholipid acyltransferase family protein [Sulfurimonas sp.]|jgi:1-acyl-sn-glycerol-3-phosphate acyltransferase|uniref:lysophospholipid acyltransferase family protein n=1 Tax=Sulfurimonas sp. TaxID=2022749 RepID=UPI0025E1CDA7|nr:lysophospholipid acyltransferase family protein [Sulfurimonas sp.]MCK9472577.1 1-acyl-sn-glycerol-3-phosphate acyltransferase [Sulfurimonas sp.]MDD3506009.1 lysophospholipid acyltransferase family protein [Sulfurimonas sp.]
MKIFAHVSWLFATIIIATSLIIMILTFHILPRPYSRKLAAWLIRIGIFFTVEVEGKEDPKAQMFLLNHQSNLDIVVMETITTRDITWVAKKELFDIPLFGLILKMPQDIAVERESKTSLIKLLRDAKRTLKTNRVITMFPEGTRSTKDTMLPFKSGAKIVADANKLCVQPIVLMQTSKYYNTKTYYYKPGRIKAIFLESFVADKNNENWLSDLRNKMQKVYDNELANNPSHR